LGVRRNSLLAATLASGYSAFKNDGDLEELREIREEEENLSREGAFSSLIPDSRVSLEPPRQRHKRPRAFSRRNRIDAGAVVFTESDHQTSVVQLAKSKDIANADNADNASKDALLGHTAVKVEKSGLEVSPFVTNGHGLQITGHDILTDAVLNSNSRKLQAKRGSRCTALEKLGPRAVRFKNFLTVFGNATTSYMLFLLIYSCCQHALWALIEGLVLGLGTGQTNAHSLNHTLQMILITRAVVIAIEIPLILIYWRQSIMLKTSRRPDSADPLLKRKNDEVPDTWKIRMNRMDRRLIAVRLVTGMFFFVHTAADIIAASFLYDVREDLKHTHFPLVDRLNRGLKPVTDPLNTNREAALIGNLILLPGIPGLTLAMRLVLVTLNIATYGVYFFIGGFAAGLKKYSVLFIGAFFTFLAIISGFLLPL
jgi:hypothetical protein